MQQSVGLGVAGDRHGADYPLGRRFEDLDAHAAGERVRARQVVGLYDPLLAVVSHRYLRKFGTAVVRAGRSLGARGGRAFSGSPSRARSGRGPGPAAGSGSPGLPAGVRPADYTACVVTKPTQAPGPGGPRPGHRDRLLLLDGHSLAYPAFHALPPENFSTTTGQPTNAVYGFTAMLINVVRDEQPTHIAVAFDRSERTFRHEQYVDYKANRKETPADFRTQLSLIFEVLDALGIRRLSVAGFEADDVIATLATEAAAEDMSVVIVTGDRDAFQLITDEVTVLKTGRGVSETTRFTPDVLQQTYGLTPAQYPDYAALRGDASDNLPGIPGVGEKTAAKWVTEFGSLAQLVDRVDEVKGRAGDNLREHLAGVLRNRQLTELIRDVPVEAAPRELAPAPWDREKINQLFDTLQFRVLRERLQVTFPNGISASATNAAAARAAGPAEEFDVEAEGLGPGDVAESLPRPRRGRPPS